MNNPITKNRLAIFSVIFYTLLNLKIILSIIFFEGWWYMVFANSNSSTSGVSISVILGLFLNIAVVLYVLREQR